MLKQLLAEIQKGGTLQPAVLAARLNVSVGLVEMMLADLERRGFLSRLDSSCGDRCGGCSLAGSCGISVRYLVTTPESW
ncbi:MAG TPA: FeoC-like transcriptional regulator [Anaerolineaceae bacterium]|nr:FeoC-like transcriptional regulator [Anaerolineaceae bacterium]